MGFGQVESYFRNFNLVTQCHHKSSLLGLSEFSPLNVLVNYGSLENVAQKLSCQYIVRLSEHVSVRVGGRMVCNNTIEFILFSCLIFGQIYSWDSHSYSVKKYFSVVMIFLINKFLIYDILYLNNRELYGYFPRNGMDFQGFFL